MPKRQRKVYHALNHPVRREIVELLGTQENLSSSELKELLNIGPGKLYYNLENLGSLIEQDEERKCGVKDKIEKRIVDPWKTNLIDRVNDFIKALETLTKHT